jgi:hypothetical protein
MVENSLVGCDVLPSATYITASQISSAFPTVQYTNTKILTLPFGRLEDGGVALGALDLLQTQGAMSTIATSAGGISAHAEVEVDPWRALGGAAVSDQSFDLIIMNPPFTRLTGGGGKSAEVSRPLFAAFGTTEADQKAMGKKATKLFEGTCYHGNAGAASAFVEIGHRKIKEGGRLGLILPLSALSGSSWEACRTLWRRHYSDVIVISIASDEPGASAFSADTGVAECMFIGTRNTKPTGQFTSVTLYRRPSSTLEGAEVARLIKLLTVSQTIRDIMDGPLGGTPLYIGEEKIGEALASTMHEGPWLLSRMYDHTLAQVAYQLTNKGVVWLPGLTATDVAGARFCKLNELGKVGPYHLDISGSGLSGGAPRGPFTLIPTANPSAATYPALKAHDEQRERHIEINPDSEGVARHSASEDARAILAERRDNIWATRTRLHFATDVRFNANALIACLTSRDAIGGRAWPSFRLADRRYEKVVTLWFNSSLGILIFWWMASKSQDGRGSVTTTRLGDLVSIDPRNFSDEELDEIDQFFDDFKSKPLLDVFECTIDAHRVELDRFVTRHLLKVPAAKQRQIEDALQLMRAKLALEPSIHGGRDGGEDLADDEDD